MTTRPTARLLTTALLLLGFAGPALSGPVEDCRSKADMTNEARLTACTAVIGGKEASGPDLAFAYYKRAMTASANPKVDQAEVMADVSKAIDIDPKLMEAYAFRALGYNKALQYDKAVADLSSAIAIAPDRWGLYSLRAMINAQRKDTKAAIADYRSALALNPPEASAAMIRQRLARLEQDSNQ